MSGCMLPTCRFSQAERWLQEAPGSSAGFPWQRECGGGQGAPGSTSLEGGGEAREGLMEVLTECKKRGRFALIGRRGWGQELCHTSPRSWG